MNTKNLSKLLSLTLAAVLSLTACGGNSDEGSASGGSAGIQSAQPESSGTTLSQYLSTGESIWYLVNGSTRSLGKDTEVDRIFLLEPDGSVYSGETEDLTLGDAAQMEDAELAQMAKEAQRSASLGRFETASNASKLGDDVFSSPDVVAECLMALYEGNDSAYLDGLFSSSDPEMTDLLETWKDAFRRYIDQLSASPDDVDFYTLGTIVLSRTDESDESTLYADLENGIAGPDALDITAAFCQDYLAAANAIVEYISTYEAAPGQYKLALNTDQTGNQTESITFACSNPQLMGDTEVISFTCRATAGEAQTVYDAAYGGMDVDGGAFVTRMEGSYDFTLEQPGESELPVDAEPEELFA